MIIPLAHFTVVLILRWLITAYDFLLTGGKSFYLGNVIWFHLPAKFPGEKKNQVHQYTETENRNFEFKLELKGQIYKVSEKGREKNWWIGQDRNWLGKKYMILTTEIFILESFNILV